MRQKDEEELQKILKISEKQNEDNLLETTKNSIGKSGNLKHIINGLTPPADKISTQIMNDLKSISVSRKESVKRKLVKLNSKK